MAKVEEVLGNLEKAAVEDAMGTSSKEVAKQFRKCTYVGRVKNFFSTSAEAFKGKLPEVTKEAVDNIGDSVASFVDTLRTPLHTLRNTDVDALIEIDAQLNAAHRKGDTKLKARLMRQREELPSQVAKEILKGGTQKQSVFEADVTQDFFDLAVLGKRSKAEDKLLKYALGGEEGITNNLLIGYDAKGKPLEKNIDTILAELGGVEAIKKGKSTGFKDFDKYISKYGEEGLKKAKVISKMFRKMSQYAGLPEQRLIAKYFPMVQGKTSVLDNMLKQLQKRFGDESLSKIFGEKFFEKARQSEEFLASELTVDEALMKYFKATKAILMRKEIKQLVELAKEPRVNDRQFDAISQIVQNLSDVQTANPVEKTILNLQKNLYEGTLTNNLSSALNNSTAIPILVSSKYGTRNTVAAIKEVAKGPGSKFYNLMEARGIGSSKNALTVILGGDYDLHGLASIDSLLARQFDAFLFTERVGVRVGGIANVYRFFNGDKVLGGWNLKGTEIDMAKKLGDLDLAKKLEAPGEKNMIEMFLESKHPETKKFMAGLIQEGSADTIFTGYLGNTAGMDHKSPLFKSAMMFMRHPLRETKFLLQHMQEGDWSTVSRYLMSKSLFTGVNGPFFLTARIAANWAMAKDPELAEQIYEYRRKILDTTLFKSIDTVGRTLNIDFSENQGLFDFAGVMLGKYTDIGRSTTLGRNISDVQKAIGQIGNWAMKGVPPEDKKIAKAAASAYAMAFGALPIWGNPKVKLSTFQVKKVYDVAKAYAKGEYEYWGFKLPVNDKTQRMIWSTLYSTTPWQADVIKYQNAQQEFEMMARGALKGEKSIDTFKEFGAVAVDPDIPLKGRIGSAQLKKRNEKPLSRLKAKAAQVLTEKGRFKGVNELIEKREKRISITPDERKIISEYLRRRDRLNQFIDRTYGNLKIEYNYY